MTILPIDNVPLINPPRVVPFTYRDGETYIDILKALHKYVVELAANINGEFAEWDAAVKSTIAEFSERIETLLADQTSEFNDIVSRVVADFNAKIDEVNGIADGMEVLKDSAEAAKDAAEQARDAAEQWAANTQALQDSAVAAIINDPESLGSKALEKKYSRVNVLDFVDSSGIVDAGAIQRAIDYASNFILDSEMVTSRSVFIPAGTYNIDTGITQPTHVHVVTEGTVLFMCSVVGSPVWWIAPRDNESNNISGGKLGKQQWNWASLMDAVGGAFIFKNTLARTGTLALELGARSDMGAQRPMSRYSVSDVVIENFDIGVQWNSYRNYIATFNRFMIELVNTCVRYGNGVNVVDAGEKLSWHDSLFASSPADAISHSITCDTVSIDFFNCSFDYLGTVVAFSGASGYQAVTFWGGHIESIQEIARGKVGTGGARPVVTLHSVPLVTSFRRMMFSGYIRLKLSLILRSLSATSLPVSYLISDEVITDKVDVKIAGSGYVRQAKSLNMIGDHMTAAEWNVASNGATTTFVDGKVYTEYTPGGYSYLTTKDTLPCTQGEMLAVSVALRKMASETVTVRLSWYDAKNELLSDSISYLLTHNSPGALTDCALPATFMPPARARGFKVRLAIASGAAVADSVIGNPEIVTI